MDNRINRAAIAQATLAILRDGFYLNRKNQRVDIAAVPQYAQSQSRYYSGEVLESLRLGVSTSPQLNTQFEVRNESTLAAVKRLQDEGHADVLCLNFASAKNPGGGFLGGAEAQEENLAKSSGLYPCIAPLTQMYDSNRQLKSCLYRDDMIYSPKVPVFRGEQYELLDDIFTVSILTAPAVNRGALARNEPERLPEVQPVMLARIDKLLALAYSQGHRVLVLGAWGCGVFGNDPKDMATWFAQALKQGRWAGVFEKVTFAVLEKKDRGCLSAFENVFG